LLAAREFITSTHLKPTKREIVHQQLHAYHGFELVDSVARLGAMNLVLHGIGPVGAEAPPPITIGDSLSIQTPKRFDLVLTNPPFGKKSSVKITHEIGAKPQALVANRSDFWATTANKQLNFLQHIASILSETGRAAVVLPDNTLFEGGAGEKVRRRLLKDFDVHTLLRLPSGIFYAQGVKANVLFFDRLTLKMRGRPRRLWVYDFRTNNHFTLKNKQLAQSDLDEFVRCYSADDRMARRSTWLPHNPGGRWRSFTYEELLERQHCSFDVCWLRNDQLIDRNTLPSPSQLGKQIAVDLRNALRNIERAIR